MQDWQNCLFNMSLVFKRMHENAPYSLLTGVYYCQGSRIKRVIINHNEKDLKIIMESE